MSLHVTVSCFVCRTLLGGPFPQAQERAPSFASKMRSPSQWHAAKGSGLVEMGMRGVRGPVFWGYEELRYWVSTRHPPGKDAPPELGEANAPCTL